MTSRRLSGAASLALAPLLAAQGLYVRWRTPRLPEPPGARSGQDGVGPPLRLLVAGDSAAAGVGAASQDEALTGQLRQQLQADYAVDWRLEATTGHRTRDALERLQALEAGPFDVVVLSVGVNDVTGMTSLAGWLAQYAELRRLLVNRFDARLVICSGLPPMHGFPALPQPLRRVLGQRATRFTEALQADLADDPVARYFDLRFTEDVSLVATDGFHPGPGVYATWAEGVAALIRRERPPVAPRCA